MTRILNFKSNKSLSDIKSQNCSQKIFGLIQATHVLVCLRGHFQRHLGEVARANLDAGSGFLWAKGESEPALTCLCILTVEIPHVPPAFPTTMNCVPTNCNPR